MIWREGLIGMKATELKMNSLYRTVELFKDLKPWEVISEYQLFAIEDPVTHVMGFCSIQGKNTARVGLKVYMGLEGLRHYNEGLELDDSQSSIQSTGNILSKETCLSVIFNQDDTQFYDCQYGFVNRSISNEWQVNFLETVLNQVLELVNLIKETPSFSLEENQILMRLKDPAGRWKTLKVSLATFLKQLNEEEVPYQNELEAYRISKLPQTNLVFEVTQFLMPRIMEDSHESRGYAPLVTVILEQETKQLILVEMSSPSRENQEQILSQVAKTLLHELEFRPKAFVTDCDAVMRQFKDFAGQTKINLLRVQELKVANQFADDLMMVDRQLSTFVKEDEFEREIDVVLSTSKEICQRILSSDVLSRELTDKGKNQFENIVELFHVVMLGHFHELPDHWSIENVELACKEVLPSLLGEEELQLVPEVLSHYLNIVGEAEKNSNYEIIEQCVRRCYL